MKKLLVLTVLLLATTIFAQDKAITKTGKITFEATVPAFEEVKAKNEGEEIGLKGRVKKRSALHYR